MQQQERQQQQQGRLLPPQPLLLQQRPAWAHWPVGLLAEGIAQVQVPSLLPLLPLPLSQQRHSSPPQLRDPSLPARSCRYHSTNNNNHNSSSRRSGSSSTRMLPPAAGAATPAPQPPSQGPRGL